MTKATGTYTYNAATTTVASYKTYFGSLSAVFGAALTRSNDTGQVVWANVTTVGTLYGRDYEVFVLNEGSLNTKPIYLRLDYAFNSGTGYSGYVVATVGTATDGAGNLSGSVVQGLYLTNNFADSNAFTRTAYASTDGSSIVLMFNIATFANAGPTFNDSLAALVLERSRDADGTPNGNGYTVWRWQQASATIPTSPVSSYAGMVSRAYDPAAYQPPVTYDYGAALPWVGQLNSYFTGTSAIAYPAYTYAGLTPQGASKALMLGWGTDWPTKTPVTVSHYNTPMQFLPMGLNASSQVPAITVPGTNVVRTGLSPLFRWE